MGTFIHLTANFKGITAEKWEHTYWESLRLLEKFPAPLMRLRLEEVLGAVRFTYSSVIRENIDAEDENWDIVGDMISNRHAENFRLYRHLDAYIKRRSYHAGFDTDVLYAEEDSLCDPSGSGVELFGDKTQDFPYHLLVLAIGILFESRFPDNIYVWGDFDRDCAERLIPWIDAVLDKPVNMPVCLDARRLLPRLDKLYDRITPLIERFSALFHGSSWETLIELAAYGGISLMLEKSFLGLGPYYSLDQLGASRIVNDLLAVTGDLSLVINLVLRVKAAKQGKGESVEGFQLEILLIQISDNIWLDWPESESISSTASVDCIASSLENRSRPIEGGKQEANRDGSKISATQALDLFSRYEPENRNRFEVVIREKASRYRNRTEVLNEIFAKLRLLSGEDDEQTGWEDESEGHADIINTNPETSLPGEDYILNVIYAQKQKPMLRDLEQHVRRLGQALRLMADKEENHKDILENFGREHYLATLYRTTKQHRFALRESAWADIDAEQGTDILNTLMLLLMIDSLEYNFRGWLIYILEHKSVWPCLVSGFREGSEIGTIDELMKALRNRDP